MDFDYKKYSLDKLEEWVHDAISCTEATPQEIYNVIKDVVSQNYYIYKNHTWRCYELLALLNGNGKVFENLVCNKDDKSPECEKAWNDFWEENYYPEEFQKYYSEEMDKIFDNSSSYQEKDKVVRWQIPVQQKIEEGIDDYYIQFPDDLLEAANLKEGDRIEWIDQGDGSYLLRKVNGTA